MSEFCWHVNIDELLRHFDMLFWCNFDGRIIDIILIYIFNIHWTFPSQTRTGLSKNFEIANVRDGGKLKNLTFYKALNKPNTVFTSVLTLLSQVIGERKYINIVTVIVILFSAEIRQIARLFSSCIMHMQRFESLQKL